MLTSSQLKKITTEARPIIERMLEDAERLAGLRDVVASAGGDWGQLKALIKAQIKDEQDEAGDGKHVRKILDKADYALGYADMLGLGNLNEENSSADDAEHDPATGEVIEQPDALEQGGHGTSQSPITTDAPASDEPGDRADRGGENVADHDVRRFENRDRDVALAGEGRGADPVALRSAVEPGAPNSEPGNGQSGGMPGSAGAQAMEEASSDVSSIVPRRITPGGQSIEHMGSVG